MKTLTDQESAELLKITETRFEKNRQRHTDIKWEDVKTQQTNAIRQR